MALTVAELNTKLTADIADLKQGLAKARADIDKFEGTSSKAGASFADKFGSKVKLGAAAAGVAVLAFGKQAIQAASSLEESLNKSNTIFGANAAAIEQWAQGAAEDFGMSKRAALDAAGTFGNMFVQLGVGSAEAAKMSQSLTELATDFASFHNANIEDVILAQTAAFRGEYDALQRFLPLINAASVEQKALEITGKKSTDMLTAQDKALAVNAMMFEGAGAAAGDFDRTSGSLANQQRTLSANLENTQAIIGQKLQPVMLEVVNWLNNDGIPGFLKFVEVMGGGIADAAGFAIGGLADLASGVAQFLEVIDSVTPGLEGIPERLQRGVAQMREMEAGLHDVSIEMEFATGAAADQAAAQALANQASNAGKLSASQLAKAMKEEAAAKREAQEATIKVRDAEIALRDAKQAIEDTQYDLSQATKEYNDLLATGGVDMEKVKAAQEDLIGTQKDMERALLDVEAAQKAVNKALEPADPKDMAKAQRNLEGANDDVTMAEISLRDAQADLNALMASGEYTADQLTAAQIRVEEADRRVADTKDRVIDAQQAINDLQLVGTTQSDAYKSASERLKEAQDKAKEATDQFHQKQEALNTAQSVAPGFADALREAQKNLREKTDAAKDATWELEKRTWAVRDAMADAKTKADSYRDALNSIPKDVTVNVKQNVTQSNLGSVTQASVSGRSGTVWVPSDFVGPLQAGWARLPKMGPYTDEQRVAAHMLGVPVLHEGGIVPGPRGADVPAILQAGERVIPADQVGSGGNTQPIVVQLVADGRIIQEILLGHQRRSGALGFN